MIDAYTIGVRLALTDELSVGLRQVRRDLAALDRASAGSAARLRELGRIGIRTGATAAPMPVRREGAVSYGLVSPEPPARHPVRDVAPEARAVRRHAVALAPSGPAMMGRRLVGTTVSTATVAGLARARLIPAGALSGRTRGLTTFGPGPVTEIRSPRRAVLPIVTPPGRRERVRPATAGDDRKRHRPRGMGALLPAGVARPLAVVRPDAPRGGPVRTRNRSRTGQGFVALMRKIARLHAAADGLRPRATRGAARIEEAPNSRDERSMAGRRDHVPTAPATGRRRVNRAAARPSGIRSRPVQLAPSGPTVGQARAPTGSAWVEAGVTRRPAAPAASFASVPSRGVATARQHDGQRLDERALPTQADLILDGVQFGRLVADRLTRHLDRPHSGAAAPDPRVTPTWPGPSIS